MRLLGNPDDPTFVNKMREMDDGQHEEKIGEDSVNTQWLSLRWMELGHSDLIFEITGKYLVREDGSGKEGWRRHVRRRRREDVKGIDIWDMDSLDI